MIARKQEINLQLSQLIDALFLGRSVLILFCLAAPAALLLKERIYIAHRTMRLRRGETGERIILAGEADKAHKILQGFSTSQRLEIHVVHIVDLEHLGTEALADAILRHNVGRVILTFGRIELDKVRRAVEACEVEGVEARLLRPRICLRQVRPGFTFRGDSGVVRKRAWAACQGSRMWAAPPRYE
jgi:FlaA1/EpsC-like NDP-sugar epimerase